MADDSARISISDILSSNLASPTLAVRVKELDTNEDGALSISELLHALRAEQNLVVQKRLLVRTVIALSVGLLLTIAAVVGLTYAIVDLSKETTVDKNNALQGKSSKQPVGTAILVESTPVSKWLDTNMTMTDFLSLEAVGIQSKDGLMQYHRLSSVEYLIGARVVFSTFTPGLSFTLTRQGIQIHDGRDEASISMLQKESRDVVVIPPLIDLIGMKTLGM